jgi:hypothetical protein
MKKSFVFIVLSMFFIGAKAQNLNESLLLHYPMSGNANNTVANSSHFPANYVAAPDRFGFPDNACSFNGSSGLVLANNWVNNQSLPQSVSLWFNTTNTGNVAYGQALFVFVGSNMSRFVMTINNGIISIEYGNGTFGTDHVKKSTDGSVFYNDGKWHHAAFVSDGDYGTGKLYIDGEFVFDVTLGDNNDNQTVDIKIGGDKVQNYYTGSIDDVRVYSRALTPSELTYLRYEYPCVNTINIFKTVTDELVIDVTIPTTAQNVTTNTLRIYPNPAKDILTINTGSFDTMTGFSIEIYNPSGSRIYQSALNVSNQQINIAGWATGLYLVKIIDPAKEVVDTRKITVR